MARACLLVGSLLVVTACSGTAGTGDSSRSDRPRAEATSTDRGAEGPEAPTVTLARLPDSTAGSLAGVEGTLRTDGGCLYLEAAGDTPYLLALTIPGARWDEQRRALIVPADPASPGSRPEAYSPGDRVSLGGAETAAAELAGLWVEPPAEACDTRRIWVAHEISTVD